MKNGPYELVIAPPEYPGRKYRGRYVYEHHLVWWKHTGMVVPEGFVIHHKNDRKRDNRFENFELKENAEHSRHHARPSKAKHGTSTKYRRGCRCGDCKKANNLATNEYRWRKGIRERRVNVPV